MNTETGQGNDQDQKPDADRQRQKVLDEKRNVSAKISDLSRYVGFGLVAVVYAIMTTASPNVIYIKGHEVALLAAAELGVLTVIFDYVQFLSGYFNVQEALQNKAGSYKYNDKSISYRLRSCAFWAKQVTALVGALVLLICVFETMAVHLSR